LDAVIAGRLATHPVVAPTGLTIAADDALGSEATRVTRPATIDIDLVGILHAIVAVIDHRRRRARTVVRGQLGSVVGHGERRFARG
jgi:hypothetical protein